METQPRILRFDALALLVSRRGEIVTKDVFMDQLWHGVPVTDEALTQCIRTLRRALGDDDANPRFIETVPKHRYRFIAAQTTPTLVSQRAQRTHIAGACTLAGLASGAAAGLMWRGRADGWLVAGTAICGLAVGPLGNLLGRASVGLL